MKTKVSADNSVEGVPSQTTAATTIANTAQSSVWSICDISTDPHVELRDITPSISPVFTDDQVHELTRNPAEVDVLSEHFLPPDTFKRIDEVLSSSGETNLLYTDPELSDTLKENHDVLLTGELGFHGTMFPSFDSIVEADRILNKRDESSSENSAEANDSQAGTSDSVNWSKDSAELNDTTGNPEGENQESDNKGLRRSPRKRVQVKKDLDVPKTSNPAGKSISRGKDISKLKYAKQADEGKEEKKEVRRSGRAQKKVEKDESDDDKKGKDKVVNNKKRNTKEDAKAQKPSSQPEDSSKNVRRSPRNQSKASMEAKQKANKKAPRKRQETNLEDSEGNKEGSNAICDGKEPDSITNNNIEDKSDESGSDAKRKNRKTDISEEVKGRPKEKADIRKSGRVTRNRGKEANEEEEKVVRGKVKSKVNKSKEESHNEPNSGETKVKDKSETEITSNESDVKEDGQDVSKRITDSSEVKDDECVSSTKKERGGDIQEKAVRKKTVEVKVEPSENKENENGRSSRRKERKSVENSVKSVEKGEQLKTSMAKQSTEDMQKTDKRESLSGEEDTNSVKEGKSVEKSVKKETLARDLTNKKAVKDSSVDPRQKGLKESQEDKESDAEMDSDNNEEFNDDSDYDPEYDPDRLWCVCRKPHGNRFMICCDHCEEWFHGICVGITMTQGRQMEKDGQDYVCPKCKAKIEATSEVPEKKSREVANAENTGGKTSSPERRHRRREHSLKMKIPGESETRKRRHFSLGKNRDEMIEEDFSGKKSRDSEKGETRDDIRKNVPEHKGFKIPKKVRTTPTPASYMHHPTQSQCVAADCSKLADYQSVYCSSECMQRHAEESIKIILEEKKKRMGCKSSVSSSKNVTSPTSNLLGPVPWNSQTAPVSSQPESSQLKEGIAVIERSTGRVIAGVAAPSQEELVDWLHDHPTFEVLRPSVGKDEKKKEKKEDSEKTVRENIRKSLREILTTRSKEQQDLNATEEDIDKCSLDVEREMFSFFGDTGQRYKNKYRSLMFNLKDPRNKVLFRHVLSGEITLDRLVRMTPEQLASPELATWREQETKHNSVKTTSEVNVEKNLPDSNTVSSTLLLDTTDEHRIHLFDLNCRICTGKMAPPGEPPRRETPAPLVSTTSIVQAVAESSVPSPTPMDIVTSASSPDSAVQPPVSPTMLAKTAKKVPAVWKGFVMMQSIAKFGTSAYRVSGPCDDLLHLLPDTLHVQGRIAHEQVWDYLLQLKSSTSREVCVIRYEASSDDEKLSYVSLYSYFYSRKRCGVVSNCYTGVKDMYLVPLASHQRVPPELLPFDGPGLDDPRPHMLLGVIVRSKVLFKRPRALSQRSLSPPPKRRTSSASVENSSSDGGAEESPTRKREVLSELHDSPPADIEDIVFQYNTTQAKVSSKETKDLSAKASPVSETSTPSVASSSGAPSSPAVSTSNSSVPSLEAQKQQLLDLQERARQYIMAQTQRKEVAAIDHSTTATSEDKPDIPFPVANDPENDKSRSVDDDAPYDPEEHLLLDLNPSTHTPTKPAVSVPPEEPSKPSSLQMLVSTLQRLQGAGSKSLSPHLTALSSILPLGATSGSKEEVNQGNETTAVATAGTINQSSISASSKSPSIVSGISILQLIGPVSSGLEAISSDSTSYPTATASHVSTPISTAKLHPVPSSSTVHLQLSAPASRAPSAVDEGVQKSLSGNVTQQYSGLRPEERARLAARESRIESRENRRLSSERRGESQEQRRLGDRERDGWHDNPRFPRDSRPSGSFESRNPRDSRSDWRDQHRSGRLWYEDEHRRDRHSQPIDERPRYQERRDERRFRGNWGRERWRR
ncbi:death-inducer obliterator 1-like [Stylophora pistillata]|uniref:PHD finger protein 3 n=1 Tax=Stylophora pistillata TaxID=50429 RepID=A0A2B4RTA5_STYPI|nr:death-inducer obliterator 1-like [Stylophora pistillata]PFX20841.1 PHD finger protein 3 [Stylophora pistillata]